MRRKRTGLVLAIALAALLTGVRAAGSEMDALVELIKKSDLVVLGQVIRIREGKNDAELAKLGVKFRTDIAVVAIVEVIKGDPDLKKVDVGFPGFPKKGEVGLRPDQNGIWLLAKSDQKFYEATTADRFLRQDSLRAVRQAVHAAMGLTKPREKPVDRAAKVSKLTADLVGKNPDSVRRLAAYQLGGMGELSVVPVLIDALDDAAPSVRVAACIALQKISGHRSQVDFQDGAATARAQGVAAWRQWWKANKDKERKDILLAGAEASRRPQPDFEYAIEGLAQYDDAGLLSVLSLALDSAISQKNSTLVIAAARYLGQAKHKASIPKLAGILDKTWPTAAARSAAAMAIGHIAGKSFGAGPEAVSRCAEWWAANRTSSKKK